MWRLQEAWLWEGGINMIKKGMRINWFDGLAMNAYWLYKEELLTKEQYHAIIEKIKTMEKKNWDNKREKWAERAKHEKRTQG
jgi:hypothetical protein